MKKLFATLALAAAGFLAQAQSVGINTTPDATAALDVTSTSKGMLVPRMTTTQRNAIATANSVSAPATGLMVYDVTLNAFYYWNGTAWAAVGGGGGPTLELFATSADAQTRPIYAYGRYTFNYNTVVTEATTGSYTNSNTYTVPTGKSGTYQINTALLMTAYSLTAVPIIVPEIQVTRGGSTIVYYGVGAANALFQGSTTDNTAGPGTGASGAPFSFSRGNANIVLPLQAGDVVKVFFRFSTQSTSASQTISFSTDGSTYLSIVKLN